MSGRDGSGREAEQPARGASDGSGREAEQPARGASDGSGREAELPARVVPDFDWLVIGSGFGGSVAALRLAEKGYRVGVLECGRRFEDEDFAKSAWNLRRYFWMPRLGMRGIMRMTMFKDVFIVSGNGVGGGSLGYANTLYRAQPAFFANPQWDGLAEWDAELRPHYDTAERMLGVADYEGMTAADELLKEYGEEIGVGDTFKHTRVGIFFGRAGDQVHDPYFGGEGPRRTGCVRGCGSGRGRSRRGEWWWPRVPSGPTSSWPTASTRGRCRGCRTGSASSCGPTPNRSRR